MKALAARAFVGAALVCGVAGQGAAEAVSQVPDGADPAPEGEVATHEGTVTTNMQNDPNNVMGMFESMMSHAAPVPTPISPYANHFLRRMVRPGGPENQGKPWKTPATQDEDNGIDPLTGKPWDEADRKTGTHYVRNADMSFDSRIHRYAPGYQKGDVYWPGGPGAQNPMFLYNPKNPYGLVEVQKKLEAEHAAKDLPTKPPTVAPLTLTFTRCFKHPRLTNVDIADDTAYPIAADDKPSWQAFCRASEYIEVKSVDTEAQAPAPCKKVVIDPIISDTGTHIRPEIGTHEHWKNEQCTEIIKEICCQQSTDQMKVTHEKALRNEKAVDPLSLFVRPTTSPTKAPPPQCTKADGTLVATKDCCGNFICEAGETWNNCPTDCNEEILAKAKHVGQAEVQKLQEKQFATQAPTFAPTKAPTPKLDCKVGNHVFYNGYHGHKDPTCDYTKDKTCYLEYCLLCDCKDGVFTCDAKNCGGPFSCYRHGHGKDCDDDSTINAEMLKDIHECRQISCNYDDSRVVVHHQAADYREAKYHRCGYNKFHDHCTCLCWHTDKYIDTSLANDHQFTAFKQQRCDDVRFTSAEGEPVSFIEGKGEVQVVLTMTHQDEVTIAHIPQTTYVERTNLTHFTVCVQDDTRLGKDLPTERTLKVNYLAWQGENRDKYGNHPFPGAASGEVEVGADWDGKDTFCQNVPFSLNWQVSFNEPELSGDPSKEQQNPYAASFRIMLAQHLHSLPDPKVIGTLQSASPSVVTWLEAVTKQEFRVCMRHADYLQAPEPMTTEDFSDRRLAAGAAEGKMRYIWFAFQDGTYPFMHFAASGSEPSAEFQHTLNGDTQHVYLSCKSISYPNHYQAKFAEPPLIFVTANHEQMVDGVGHSVNTWLDHVTTTAFKVCSVELHEAKIPNYTSQMTWDWVAFDRKRDTHIANKFKTHAETMNKRFAAPKWEQEGAGDIAGKAFEQHLMAKSFWHAMADERNAKRVAEIKQHVKDLAENPKVAHIAHLLNAGE